MYFKWTARLNLRSHDIGWTFWTRSEILLHYIHDNRIEQCFTYFQIQWRKHISQKIIYVNLIFESQVELARRLWKATIPCRSESQIQIFLRDLQQRAEKHFYLPWNLKLRNQPIILIFTLTVPAAFCVSSHVAKCWARCDHMANWSSVKCNHWLISLRRRAIMSARSRRTWEIEQTKHTQKIYCWLVVNDVSGSYKLINAVTWTKSYLFADGANEDIPDRLEFPQADDILLAILEIRHRALAILAVSLPAHTITDAR